VLVLGATSQIGHYLLPLLMRRGFEAIPASRRVPTAPGTPRPWVQIDPRQGVRAEQLPGRVDATISLVPLMALPALVDGLAELGTRRILAFGSTSVVKHASADPRERDLAAALGKAEADLVEACQRHAIAWTLFRPTLTYSDGLDGNVSEIARFVRRFRAFPLVGTGCGLRQPVYAADLAAACVSALQLTVTCNTAYTLSGGRTLTYREMVEEIFRALGMQPRFVPLPIWLVKLAIRAARCVPRYAQLSPELATRMNQDLCFDSTPAQRDFGFAPRGFSLENLSGLLEPRRVGQPA
jgi:nucleoside-diphosphate-sugar epimerase